MSYETIRYEVADGIATITLNRPERLNTYTAAMMREIIDAIDRVDADDAVRAVIVTGAGRAFCAGLDLAQGSSLFIGGLNTDPPFHPDGTPDYSRESARDDGGRITLRLYRCLKPVIAAINGPAIGIGATMILAMDIRLASETARMGFVFARRGIVPESACSWFLPKIVGVAQALEWCFSGRIFSADEAKSGGLVSRIFHPDELLPAARALAREIADNTAPVAVALIRQMVWRGAGAAHPMDAHKVDSRAILSRGISADVAEGVAAFMEKRPAHFPDRISADMPDFYPWWDEPIYS